MSRLQGWTPFRAGWSDGADPADRPDMMVDWCHLGTRRFTDPFFYETISLEVGHPFNAAFRQRMPADDLALLPPGLAPSGFIFHTARCGSTLCAQALAADPAHIVLSEPVPVRALLEAPRQASLEPAQADAWLYGILSALARPRFSDEQRVFVKFMAADVLDLGWVAQLYPEVPWLFLYRDPLEILASQRRLGGGDTMPGAIPPQRLGLSLDDIFAMRAETYQLTVMAALGRVALDEAARHPGRGLFLRYDDLPRALLDRLPAHFGFAPSPAVRAAMEAVTYRYTKAPDRAFSPDGAAKRREGAPWRQTAEAITGQVFAALDAARDSAR